MMLPCRCQTRTQAHYGCRCFTRSLLMLAIAALRIVYIYIYGFLRAVWLAFSIHTLRLTYCLCRFMYRNFRLLESESTMYCNHIMCPFNGTNIHQFICIRCLAEFSLRRFHILHSAKAEVGFDAQIFGCWIVFSRPLAHSRLEYIANV